MCEVRYATRESAVEATNLVALSLRLHLSLVASPSLSLVLVSLTACPPSLSCSLTINISLTLSTLSSSHYLVASLLSPSRCLSTLVHRLPLPASLSPSLSRLLSLCLYISPSHPHSLGRSALSLIALLVASLPLSLTSLLVCSSLSFSLPLSLVASSSLCSRLSLSVCLSLSLSLSGCLSLYLSYLAVVWSHSPPPSLLLPLFLTLSLTHPYSRGLSLSPSSCMAIAHVYRSCCLSLP